MSILFTIAQKSLKKHFSSSMKELDKSKIVEKEAYVKYTPGDIARQICDNEADKPQSLEDSLRDTQIDIIIPLILLRYNNDNCSIADIGCGPEGNLFFNCKLYDKYNTCTKSINMYGVDEKLNLDNRITEFENAIYKFLNGSKQLKDVFFSYSSDLIKYINTNNLSGMDYIILKNVLHEIDLVDLPRFLIEIYNLCKERSNIVIFEVKDIFEDRRCPWIYEDFYGIFSEFFNSNFKFIEYPETNKRSSLILLNVYIDKKLTNFKSIELRSKLIEVANKKAEIMISKKNSYKSDEAKKTIGKEKVESLVMKYKTYHSNIDEQIRVAKKAWGME